MTAHVIGVPGEINVMNIDADGKEKPEFKLELQDGDIGMKTNQANCAAGCCVFFVIGIIITVIVLVFTLDSPHPEYEQSGTFESPTYCTTLVATNATFNLTAFNLSLFYDVYVTPDHLYVHALDFSGNLTLICFSITWEGGDGDEVVVRLRLANSNYDTLRQQFEIFSPPTMVEEGTYVGNLTAPTANVTMVPRFPPILRAPWPDATATTTTVAPSRNRNLV